MFHPDCPVHDAGDVAEYNLGSSPLFMPQGFYEVDYVGRLDR